MVKGFLAVELDVAAAAGVVEGARKVSPPKSQPAWARASVSV